MGGENRKGGMELDKQKEYHIYDFWNRRYLGIYKGDGSLRQVMRPGEARMLSVREALFSSGCLRLEMKGSGALLRRN